MKRSIYIYLLLVFILGSVDLNGQCLPERHSATWYDGWISCQGAPVNPNKDRGENTHYIMYDLQSDFYLYEMLVWNMNAPDILNYGLQNVYIDLSFDGQQWTEYGQFTFSQAPGSNDFEGIEEIDFEGTKARYVLITAIDNYGGSCYGLSEVKIRAREICPQNVIAWIADDGDWDVASNWCNNQIPTDQDSVWIPPHKNINIPLNYTAEALWLDIDEHSSIEVNGNLDISLD